MGGMITQQMCVDFQDLARERIAGTILLSTAAAVGQNIPGWATMNRVVKPGAIATRAAARGRDSWMPGGEVGYALARLALGVKADPRHVTHTLNMTAALSPATMTSLMPHVVGFDLRAKLKHYPVPALVITGSRDLLTPPRMGKELARLHSWRRFRGAAGRRSHAHARARRVAQRAHRQIRQCSLTSPASGSVTGPTRWRRPAARPFCSQQDPSRQAKCAAVRPGPATSSCWRRSGECSTSTSSCSAVGARSAWRRATARCAGARKTVSVSRPAPDWCRSWSARSSLTSRSATRTCARTPTMVTRRVPPPVMVRSASVASAPVLARRSARSAAPTRRDRAVSAPPPKRSTDWW